MKSSSKWTKSFAKTSSDLIEVQLQIHKPAISFHDRTDREQLGGGSDGGQSNHVCHICNYQPCCQSQNLLYTAMYIAVYVFRVWIAIRTNGQRTRQTNTQRLQHLISPIVHCWPVSRMACVINQTVLGRKEGVWKKIGCQNTMFAVKKRCHNQNINECGYFSERE